MKSLLIVLAATTLLYVNGQQDFNWPKRNGQHLWYEGGVHEMNANKFCQEEGFGGANIIVPDTTCFHNGGEDNDESGYRNWDGSNWAYKVTPSGNRCYVMIKSISCSVWGRLKHISTNKCLYNNDSGVYGWGCWNDENMAYSLDKIQFQNDYFQLRHLRTGECIRAGDTNGSRAQSVTCNSFDDNQKFELVDAGKGTIRLKSKNNQCLFSQNWNGGTANTWGCWADPNMRFVLESVFFPNPNVVTLGDSYSSGTGIWPKDNQYDEQYGGYVAPWKLTPRDDNECWREKDTTPGPTYASATGDTSIFLACKGAEAIHIENQIDLMNSQYPVSAATNWEDSVILFTAGGNDIRTNDGQDWPELLRHCILEANIFKGCDDHDKNQISNWSTIQTRVQSIYTKLAMTASGARVRVLGYPRIMQRDPGCSSVTGVGRDEADWMDDQVDTLNSKLQTAVNNVKNSYPNFDIKFVSMNNYITRGACARPSGIRQVNDKVLDGISTSDSSFHPTTLGYQKYYQAFVDSL